MEEFKERRKKFDKYLETNDIKISEEVLKYTCPCCGFPTLAERGDYEICILCNWEDDAQDDEDADEIFGGPNSDLSLTQGRNNFQKYLHCNRDTLVDQNNYKNIRKKLITLFYDLLNKNVKKEITECFEEYQSKRNKDIKELEKNQSKKSHHPLELD